MSSFNVFHCHNSADKPAVKAIGKRLKKAGAKPWLDEWEPQPGQTWQDQLQTQIEDIGAAAVFVGKDGEGPWQALELQAFLQQFVKLPIRVKEMIRNQVRKWRDRALHMESL